MLFPTLAFAVFFLFVYLVSWSLDRENGRRKLFLLLASWFFYAQWDWRFVALLIASAVLNWGVGALIAQQSGPKKAWLVGLGVAANLLILGFFKYYGFFIEQAGDLLMRFGWERDLPLLQIVLPVGISFFTFQGISYVVDVHRGKTPPAKSLLDVMLLMSFFPHLVAGPIVRASDLLPQFDQAPRLTRAMARVPQGARPRVVYVQGQGGGALALAGGGSHADALVTMAGGTNPFASVNGNKPLTSEALAGAAPDVLVATARTVAVAGGRQRAPRHRVRASSVAGNQTESGK